MYLSFFEEIAEVDVRFDFDIKHEQKKKNLNPNYWIKQATILRAHWIHVVAWLSVAIFAFGNKRNIILNIVRKPLVRFRSDVSEGKMEKHECKCCSNTTHIPLCCLTLSRCFVLSFYARLIICNKNSTQLYWWQKKKNRSCLLHVRRRPVPLNWYSSSGFLLRVCAHVRRRLVSCQSVVCPIVILFSIFDVN